MTSITVPMCAVCTHLDASQDKMACKAFPEGIPDAIVESRADHRKPISGDMGITFEQDADKPAVADVVEDAEFDDQADVKHTDITKALEAEEERKRRILRELEAADRDEPDAPDKPSRQRRDEYLTLLGAGLTAALTSGIGYGRQGRMPRAEDAAESALARMHSAAYRMGMRTLAPDHAWTASDQDALSKIVQGQMGYFQGFLNDVRAGQLSDEQIRARTALYMETLWGSFNRGMVTGGDEVGIGGWVWNTQGDASVCGLCEPRDGEHYTTEELPGFPGEGDFGDLCEGACRCWLEPYTL